MLVVDTSVWIDYFNGKISHQTNYLDEVLSKQQILLGDIILTEILQGFREKKAFQKAKKILSPLLFVNMWGKEIALLSADHYRFLRKKGITLKKKKKQSI